MQASPQSSVQAASTPPSPSATAFAPLPLRARGVLEILDVAIKVYKQYFWVLIGWSALVIIGSALASVLGMVVPFGGTLPSVMLTPLMTGVVCCCIAAAVRGQRVEFKQCWDFTKPRFWPMVGYYVIALIITVMVLGAVFAIFGLLALLGVWAFSSAPQSVQITMAIVGGFLALTIGTVLATVVLTWHYLVPVVVCMEEDKKNAQALARAYELLKKQWLPICTLMTVVGLGMIALWLILGVVGMLLVGFSDIQRALTGQQVPDAKLWGMAIAAGLSYVGLWMIWTPLFNLILVLFYLDVRIRQEALDLEWSAHVTAPPREAGAFSTPGLASPGLASSAAYSFGTPPAPPNFAPVESVQGNINNTYPSAYYAPTAPAPSTGWSALTANDLPASNVSPPPLSPAPTAEPLMPMTEAAHPTPPAASVLSQEAQPVEAQPPTNAQHNSAPSITCPQCGAPAPASHIFCMRCGNRLKPPEEQSVDSKPMW